MQGIGLFLLLLVFLLAILHDGIQAGGVLREVRQQILGLLFAADLFTKLGKGGVVVEVGGAGGGVVGGVHVDLLFGYGLYGYSSKLDKTSSGCLAFHIAMKRLMPRWVVGSR